MTFRDYRLIKAYRPPIPFQKTINGPESNAAKEELISLRVKQQVSSEAGWLLHSLTSGTCHKHVTVTKCNTLIPVHLGLQSAFLNILA